MCLEKSPCVAWETPQDEREGPGAPEDLCRVFPDLVFRLKIRCGDDAPSAETARAAPADSAKDTIDIRNLSETDGDAAFEDYVRFDALCDDHVAANAETSMIFGRIEGNSRVDLSAPPGERTEYRFCFARDNAAIARHDNSVMVANRHSGATVVFTNVGPDFENRLSFLETAPAKAADIIARSRSPAVARAVTRRAFLSTHVAARTQPSATPPDGPPGVNPLNLKV